jgi:hypothetical protein
VDFGPPYNELPLRFGTNATEATVIYVDVSLLNVQVRKTNNVREISWNSMIAKTNRVEFTTDFPSFTTNSWTTLVTTNGTGENMTVRDPATAASRRFYRVIVDY